MNLSFANFKMTKLMEPSALNEGASKHRKRLCNLCLKKYIELETYLGYA